MVERAKPSYLLNRRLCMPSIENLRKQAKRIVRWHRDGHHPVATLIRTHLPPFSGMSDFEILAHRFQLTDAQDLIARQNGFDSWQALLEGPTQMPEPTTNNPSSIAFVRAEPQLFVTDIARSLTFYKDLLGFKVEFTYGEPAFYAQVSRGGAHLNLRYVDQPLKEPILTLEEDLLAASICVQSIKELYLEFQTRGVLFHQNLHTEPWGSRTFIVADPDKNLILFAE